MSMMWNYYPCAWMLYKCRFVEDKIPNIIKDTPRCIRIHSYRGAIRKVTDRGASSMQLYPRRANGATHSFCIPAVYVIGEDLADFSTLDLLAPFVRVVRFPEANGVLTEAALKALQALLGQNIIGKGSATWTLRLLSITDDETKSASSSNGIEHCGQLDGCCAADVN